MNAIFFEIKHPIADWTESYRPAKVLTVSMGWCPESVVVRAY